MNKLNEPNKQESASDHCGLLPACMWTATAWKRLLTRTVLLSLLMLATMIAVSSAALAQNPGTPLLPGGGNNNSTSGQVGPPTPGSSPSGSRGTTGPNGYFARFPFAKQAYQADTTSKSSAGVLQSNPGTAHTWQAYSFVLKMCDEGYGIAYFQIPMMATGTPAAARDSELFQNLLTTYGLPMSDSQFQIIQRENNQRLLELAFDPERVMWMTSATSQTSSSQASKSMANSGLLALNAAFQRIVYGDGNGSLINVANEGSVAGLTYRGAGNDINVAQSVSMIQQMYKAVFIPMAVLFLLPGAVISQVKSIMGKGFGLQNPESQSPFDGILRSIVAVFLIPSTQVIMSWGIDTGNSLAYTVRDWVNLTTIMSWAQQLCYSPALSVNAMTPPNPSSSTSG